MAVVLATLLIASALLALGQGAAGHAAGVARMHAEDDVTPAAPFLTYTILNGYGMAAVDFYPGETYWGTLFFTVTDSNPADKGINVTITDPNATRDGLPTPAFQYAAVLSTATTPHSYNSYAAGVGYKFPATLPYNGRWVVNFSASASNYIDAYVGVQVYSVSLSTSVGDGSTLPGQPLEVFWNLFSEAN